MDYLEIIRQAEEAHQPIGSTSKTGGKPARSLQAPSVKPGDRISWTRGDLTVQHGVVDFLHTADDGTSWAFVTLSSGWVAVNTK
jgi:hypothetical protein